MSSPSTFTVSAEGGLIKSDSVSRSTLLTLTAHTGDLKKQANLTIRVSDGGNSDVDLSMAGMTTAKVLAIEPSVEDEFGDDDSSGVTVKINAGTPGIVLKGRCFLLMVECEVTSLNIANNSGSEISANVFLAGE